MKLIIKNNSSLDHKDAFNRVSDVMDLGFVSEHRYGKGYCHVSAYNDCVVSFGLTKTGTHVAFIDNKRVG